MHACSAQGAIRLHSSGPALLLGAKDCQLENETLPTSDFVDTVRRFRKFGVSVGMTGLGRRCSFSSRPSKAWLRLRVCAETCRSKLANRRFVARVFMVKFGQSLSRATTS